MSVVVCIVDVFMNVYMYNRQRIMCTNLFVLFFKPQLTLTFFFLNDPPPPEFSSLPLHDALPISLRECIVHVARDAITFFKNRRLPRLLCGAGEQNAEDCLCSERSGKLQIAVMEGGGVVARHERSEEHTSELQSPCNLVCRLLLEK